MVWSFRFFLPFGQIQLPEEQKADAAVTLTCIWKNYKGSLSTTT
ncbi:hypothetical protein [Paenibacillus sp. CAA11]|nr:hypothetical protein [Paenibacillus sp. CAA11]